MSAAVAAAELAARAEPAVVVFSAPSGTGKTTLIERLIPLLRERGLRVAAVKSDAHRLELDRPGKDSWRLRQAGAETTLLVGQGQVAVFGATPQVDLRTWVRTLLPGVDLVLVEGFRASGEAAVVIQRKDGPPNDGWTPPAAPIAIACDVPLEAPLPVLDLNRPDQLAAFLCEHFGLPAAPAA